MCSNYSLGRHPSTTIYLIPAPSEKTTYAKNSTLPRLVPTVSPTVVVVASTRPGVRVAAAAAAVAVAPFVPSSISTASMIFVVVVAESVVVAAVMDGAGVGILAGRMGDETGKASTTSTTDSVVPPVRST